MHPEVENCDFWDLGGQRGKSFFPEIS
jgi:hypothetical protein